MPIANDLATDLANELAYVLSGPANSPQSILGSLYHSDFVASDLSSTPVSSWPNRGTDGAPLVQGTGANQPAWSATSFHGGPGVTGDGVNDVVVASFNNAIAAGSRPYLWIVCQYVAAAGAAQILTLICNSLAAAPSHIQIAQATPNVANWGLLRNDSSGNNAGQDTGFANDANFDLVEAGFTVGGTNSFVLNGNGFNASVNGNTANTTGFLSLFAGITGNAPANVRIARAIVASDEPSAAQKTAMRTFLRGANFPGYTGNTYGLP